MTMTGIGKEACTWPVGHWPLPEAIIRGVGSFSPSVRG